MITYFLCFDQCSAMVVSKVILNSLLKKSGLGKPLRQLGACIASVVTWVGAWCVGEVCQPRGLRLAA